MKINIFFIFFIVYLNSGIAQDNFQLFHSFDYHNKTLRSSGFLKNAVFADLNFDNLSAINRIKPMTWNFSLPVGQDGRLSSFIMSDFDFIDSGLEVIGTESGKSDYKKGIYYIATGEDGESSGTFALYDDKIMGLIVTGKGENYNFGEIADRPGKYIIYKDSEINIDHGFYCDTRDDEAINEIHDEILSDNRDNLPKCIDIYIEADYALYVENGYSINNTVNFILGLFAETALLLRNEGINIKVSRIKVWQTPDSYNTTSSHKALDQFGDNNPDSKTDLNLLLALGGKGLGGVAYINGLCNEGTHFAYANIDSTFDNIPNYSWSVMVITHELGHNLGSSHTHSCSWTSDFKQIDDCGNVHFYNQGTTPEGNKCFDPDNPIIPLDGGTIMSYCHLIGVAGINLSKGFGEHPGNLIRKRVSNADCVNTCINYGDSIPVAQFTSKSLTCVEGEIKFNDISMNNPSEWVWIFEKEYGHDTAYHKFPVIKYLNEGQFDVSLIARNAIGSDTIMKIDHVNVIPGPIAGFSYDFVNEQTIQFKNTSDNADKYFWKFGDSNVSFLKEPKHKFNKGGKYIVELRATKDTCNTHNYISDTIEIKIPFKASISYNKSVICPGDSIYFQATGMKYDSVKWTFSGGDIETSTNDRVFVKYTKTGEYDVGIITFSPYGSDTLVKTNLIKVNGIPEIYFDYTSNSDTVFFNNLSLEASSFTWDFGDSTVSTQLNPIHIYEKSGKYVVSLNGKNSCFGSEFNKEIIIQKVSVVDESKPDMKIFPNPGSGNLNIIISEPNAILNWIRIKDMKGKTFSYDASPFEGEKNNIRLDLNYLRGGIYQIEISTNIGIYSSKIVIIK